jgi:hypothetical protein
LTRSINFQPSTRSITFHLVACHTKFISSHSTSPFVSLAQGALHIFIYATSTYFVAVHSCRIGFISIQGSFNFFFFYFTSYIPMVVSVASSLLLHLYLPVTHFHFLCAILSVFHVQYFFDINENICTTNSLCVIDGNQKILLLCSER